VDVGWHWAAMHQPRKERLTKYKFKFKNSRPSLACHAKLNSSESLTVSLSVMAGQAEREKEAEERSLAVERMMDQKVSRKT